MLSFLIGIGRVVIVFAAAGTILVGAVSGWLVGAQHDATLYQFSDAATLTPNRIGFCLLGLFVGVVVAGCTFGLIAAIFEIHRHVRNLDRTQRSETASFDLEARERERREPQLA